MSSYKVEICGVNTAKLPILKEKEKEALFEKILAGDRQAREEYIKGNLRLVLSIIQRFSNSGENIDELFQIGCIGLMKSIDHFDQSGLTTSVRSQKSDNFTTWYRQVHVVNCHIITGSLVLFA